MKISTQKAKEISIEKYLAMKGHRPVKEHSGELYYFSPLREQEKTPSFAVNVERNIWIDLGLDMGGSIIDLVMAMYNFNINKSLEYLADYTNDNLYQQVFYKGKNLFQKENSIEIERINPLTNYVLLKYFREERGISDALSKKYLKEIWYENKGRKKLFAAGWENDSGSYELRSSLFKGVTGQKDISTIRQPFETCELYLFEGMTDFLSALMFKKCTALNATVIILNGASLVKRIFPILESKKWEKIFTFFDNDEGGITALNKLKENVPKQILFAQNDFYKNYRDLNECWINKKQG